jgi:hypothetical protein
VDGLKMTGDTDIPNWMDLEIDGTKYNPYINSLIAKSGELPEGLKAFEPVLKDNKLYFYEVGHPYGGESWFKPYYINGDASSENAALIAAFKKKLNGYKTGGLADFTGPAWLDGTPSKPEYILNAQQTERFFSLVDILEGFKTDTEPKKASGDNYFDINISVEKIEDDYDVEQMADKIRRMIYDDATYRNVNAINHIR